MYRIKPAQPATRRPSYLDGLDYIAHNDEPTCMSADEMTGMPSVQLLGVLFGMPAGAVAFDVIRIRTLIQKEEGK